MLSRFDGLYDAAMTPLHGPRRTPRNPLPPALFAGCALAVLLATVLAVPGASRGLAAGQQTPAPGRRIVAIGDVHGAFDQLVGILQAAGLK